ncbi:TetR/AcrR family transcriptional regulator [Paenibacillus sp. P25]|nr:TetR/AcrR family transcriptional regulator [Paenibacillus sp. P25]
MTTRQKLRSEETRNAILSAAGRLFAERGFHTVTMREIAKEAGRSHTTIYIYFKDKEEPLHELSTPPLQEMKRQFEDIASREGLSPEGQLKEMSQEFIRFCLRHKNMYTVIFVTKGTSVEEKEPALAINKLRFELFGLIQRQVQRCLGLQDDDRRLLTCGRIYFYTLHGIVSTYAQSEEPLTDLLSRLESTFEETVEVLLLGFKQKLNGR